MFLSWILALLGFYCIYRFSSRSTNLPPGPFNLPILGYIPFIKQPVHKEFARLSKIYGDIFSLSLGTKRIVVLSSLDSIRDAFKQEVFNGRPDFPLFTKRSEDKKGIIFSEGETWSQLRRFTLRTLRDFGFGKSSLESIIKEEIKELVENLKSIAGQPVELNYRFNLAVVNALWTITTGERIKQDDAHMKHLIETLSKQIQQTSSANIGLFLPFINYFPPFKGILHKQLKHIQNMKAVMMDTIIRHQLQTSESDFIHTFMERTKKCSDVNSPFYGKDAERQLVITLLDLFVAGAETTSTSLLWFFLMMATYPKIQQKIQKEIDHFVPADDLPSIEYRSKFIYTEAVLMETLRYSSLAPFGVFHVCLQTTKLGSYVIPKDTVMMPNLHQVMHDPQLWEKPDEFYPEHFLNSDGTLKIPDAYIPFSTGKRMCLGETLAKTEFFLFAVSLLKNFTFAFSAEENKPPLEPVDGLILSPPPYKVIVIVR